jgi:hypothetical protein
MTNRQNGPVVASTQDGSAAVRLLRSPGGECFARHARRDRSRHRHRHRPRPRGCRSEHELRHGRPRPRRPSSRRQRRTVRVSSRLRGVVRLDRPWRDPLHSRLDLPARDATRALRSARLADVHTRPADPQTRSRHLSHLTNAPSGRVRKERKGSAHAKSHTRGSVARGANRTIDVTMTTTPSNPANSKSPKAKR